MLPLSKLPARCMTSGLHEKMLRSCVWSAAWLRQAEVEAARAHDITLYALMQRAGKAAFDVFRREYPASRHWLILCGSGNNGGDGYEIARLAADANLRVTVVAIKGAKPLPPEATAALAALHQRGGVAMHDAEHWDYTATAKDVDLVVDGLLGTGIGGAPRADYARLIDWVNALPVPRVAIDIPSGLNAETGVVEGACVRAEHTVTFIALKPGLLTGRARDFTGTLHYNCLQVGEWMLAKERQEQLFCRRLSSSHLQELLAQTRSPCAHKGMNGKVVIIGGDFGFGGAIVMAAEAALRTGAGLVRVLSRPQHALPLLSRCPEVMTAELTPDNLGTALDWSTCVVVGPGLGQDKWGSTALAQVLAHCQEHPEKPSVWDADALNLMAAGAQTQKGGADLFTAPLKSRIITPHPGEAARLLRCTTAEVEHDRFRAAQRLAETYGGVALLKGPGTVLYTAEGAEPAAALSGAARELLSARCVVADAGNCGMATGGAGDVLTGVIAGLLAQQFPQWHAACVGCLVHGTAGDLAAAAQGGVRGLRATALLEHLTTCVNPAAEEQWATL
ncbi:putative protein kinase [Trypanosoma conorhini]|uniref:Bifunctional NAD(P)H-hydrate repair enzyme n=1 Tax=Trypanosoma conorhini TaxID=83891 RepID=A0A422PX88_9TRYP|nr:putative protein kinase [Trypanosoma conorhini]RNF22364.1 putative protein kinase [Trypanosoma conorhini]